VLKELIADYRGIWREPVCHLSGVFILLLLLLHLADGALGEWLEFNGELIGRGQWWRLYTGHFVHFGLYHTAMNCAGFIGVVFTLFRDVPLRILLLAILWIPLFAGLGIYWVDLEIYRGFSGSNYGLLALGLILGLHHNYRLYALAILVVTAKIASEHVPDYDVNYLRDKIGVAVAVEAHLSGYVAGVCLGVGLLILRRVRGKAHP
jgi:rhomboid family GlyGly-CTERM serine protease